MNELVFLNEKSLNFLSNSYSPNSPLDALHVTSSISDVASNSLSLISMYFLFHWNQECGSKELGTITIGLGP